MHSTLGPLYPLGEITTAVLALALVLTFAWSAREAWRVVRDGARRQEVGLVLALGGVAYLMRWSTPAAPFDVTLRVVFPSEGGAVDFMSFYGLGMLAWTGLWEPIIGAVRPRLYEVHALVGAVSVAALWAVLRDQGLEVRTTVWCTAAFAMDPILARWAHTDVQHTPAHLVLLLALHALARWKATDRWTDGLVASVGLAAAMQFRNAYVLQGILACAWLWALPGAFPWRRRSLWGWGALTLGLLIPHGIVLAGRVFGEADDVVDPAAFGGGLTGLFRGGGPLEGLGAMGLEQFTFFDDYGTPSVMSVAFLVGMVAGRARPPVRAVLVGAAFGLSLLGAPWHTHNGHWISQRHQLMGTVWAPVVMGLGWDALVRFVPRPGDVLVVALALWGMTARIDITRRVPGEVAEWRFLQATLPYLPAGCVIYHVDGVYTLSPLDWHSEELGLGHVWHRIDDDGDVILPGTPEDTERDAACRVYLRMGECFTTSTYPERWRRSPDDDVFTEPAPLNDRCGTWEAAVDLTPLGTTRLPNFTHAESTYAEGVLEVGWFLFEERTPDVSPSSAPPPRPEAGGPPAPPGGPPPAP